MAKGISKQGAFYTGILTVVLILLALSFVSYSRATIGTHKIKEAHTILEDGGHEVLLEVMPVNEKSHGFARIELLAYDKRANTVIVNAPLKITITKTIPEQWPLTKESKSQTLYYDELITDMRGRVSLDQRFEYSEDQAQWELRVEMPDGSVFTHRLG